MNLQRGKQLRNLLANLQVIAGSLLLLGFVTHALLAGFITPECNSSTLSSRFCEMWPMPGGIVAPVPEIDSGSAGTAIALLIGGLLVLSGLRTKRQARPE
jgi:hypothetical protein